MILGIGIDAVNILRFTRYADTIPRFLIRLFSQSELNLSQSQLAGNFAAREAFLKACPTEYRKLVSRVEFLRDANGKPTVNIPTVDGLPIANFCVHISITNLDNLVFAVIIMETLGDIQA